MQMQSQIRGIGLVGGFGCGAAALQKALQQRHTSRQMVDLETTSGPVRFPALLADTSALAGFLSKAALRRLNHYSRMALLAAYTALDDANLLKQRPSRLGIIVCTGQGATINIALDGTSPQGITDIFGSPTRFASSVHNAAAGLLAIALKETGPNLSVSQFDMSVPQGLLSAQLWLAENRVEAVLVGGVDGCCYELARYLEKVAGGRDQVSGGRDQVSGGRDQGAGDSLDWPYCSGDDFPAVGEGAAFVVLTAATSEGKGYARMTGVEMGGADQVRLPSPPMVIIGADGAGPYDAHYAGLLAPAVEIANYSAIYGISAVGQMFDVVIAALALHEGEVYPSGLPLPAVCRSGELGAWPRVEAIRPLKGEAIRCLKLGVGGAYAHIDLEKA